MARTNKATAAVAATPATPATRAVPANAHKYGAGHRNVAVRGVTYALTPYGASVAASGGLGKGGKPTVMGAVALGAAAATANGGTATGVAIVAGIIASPAARNILRQCKATKYAGANSPCPAWLSGYVSGAARQGLLALPA